ncbi:MAG: hypothetical protein AUK48_01210 [Oscillatoriales cyanobacterium CG2_30_44_21]|nr:MAG: hypothetical protein AUK48_01210 [Oscillatoriales cyanobacterium CG2_30_44_21]
MFIWSVLTAKVFEVGMTVIDDVTGTIGQFFRTTILGEGETYQSEDENAIALALRNNSDAMQYFAEAQMQLAEVQQQQNELKKTELMINVALAQKERELKAQLSELWRDLKRELQRNDLSSRQDLQVRQIQADWDKIKLPTIFSRQELENLAQDRDRLLFVCAKMQVTEGCPDYFRTELAADAESQIKKFANLVFQGNVRFYSRFFDDENIFDANAAQLKSILPNVPCVMSFSKITRRKAYFHYQMWGSRSAEILKGNFDVELPWREVAQQIRDEASETINDDDLYEIIGDWLTTLQKIYALFLVDLYAIVDGDDPFYAIKLDSVSLGVPEQTASQYIQPLAEILQRVQNERIESFNEQLHRQKEEEIIRQEKERKRLASLKSEIGMESEYQRLDALLAEQKWFVADELTKDFFTYTALYTSNSLYEKFTSCGDFITYLNSCKHENEHEMDHIEFHELNPKEYILCIPCQDLQTIDHLWMYHSNGKFGFSVQKELWLNCGGKIGVYNYEVFKEFGAQVGWYKPEEEEGKTAIQFADDTQNGHNAVSSSFPRMDGTYLCLIFQRLLECDK